MKVFVIGRFYNEAFATFVAEGLVDLGHTVVRFDPGPKLLSFGSRTAFYLNRIRMTAHSAISAASKGLGLNGDTATLRRALDADGKGTDLVLSTHDYLTPHAAALVKRITGAPLALWYPDPIWSFQKHMFLNAPYDLLFFKDPYLVDLLKRKIEAQVFYLPECFSPASLSTSGEVAPVDSRYVTELTTAGNLYAYRVAFWNKLADFDAKIWGLPAPLWMDIGAIGRNVQNRFVAHEEKATAFRSAKIVLNNLNPAEIWGTNVRTFEICGAGGFQLVDWRPGLGQLFDIGRELIAFDTMADLREKIAYYLIANDERACIADAGRKRAHRDHTYTHRLKLLVDTVAGRERGYPMPIIRWVENNAS